LETERERERGESWEDEGRTIEVDIRDLWGWLKATREFIKDQLYEIFK
jgi:hypothetical protein